MTQPQTHSPLTSAAPVSDIKHQVGEVSPESLRTLIQRVKAGTAKAEEQALFEHLAGEMVDAYTRCSFFKNLPQMDFLRQFFVSGDASDSARRLGLSERTGRDWISQFCRFLPLELKRQADRQRTIDTARAQCAESCGRRYRVHDITTALPSSNPIPTEAEAKRMKAPRRPPELKQCESRPQQGGRCPDCPLTGLGL